MTISRPTASIHAVRTPAPREIWANLLRDDPRALPEHAPQWTTALCANGRYTDASRLYEFNDGRRFVLPLVRRRGPAGAGGWLLSYPPAFGIGGMLGAGQDAGVVGSVLAELSGMREARIWLRPNPLDSELWAGPQPTVLTIPRMAHVLDLHGGVDVALSGLHASTRRGLRVAHRSGVRVVARSGPDLLDTHHELYRLSLRRWALHQHEPVVVARLRSSLRDSQRTLDALARGMGDDFVVLVAYLGFEPVASIVTVLGPTAHDIRGAMNRELAGPSRSNELLQWHSIRLACERGCGHLHLGESGRSLGLARFKERFGARPVRYREYRLERIPYTRASAVVRTVVKSVLGFRDDEGIRYDDAGLAASTGRGR